MTQDEKKSVALESMNKLIFFNFNFCDFLEMIKYIVDGDEQNYMYQHFKNKWLGLYESVGARAVMLTFYCELDTEYRRRMLEYIYANYNDEQKL